MLKGIYRVATKGHCLHYCKETHLFMTRGLFSCLGSGDREMVGGGEGVERPKQPFQVSGGLFP